MTLTLIAIGGPRLAAAQDAGVTAPIQRLYSALLETMKAGSRSVPFAQRFQTLSPVIDQVFNLPVILQTSIGPLWSTIPPADQQSLSQAFRSYTVASYVNSFDEYSGQRLDVLPTTRPGAPAGDQIVQTRIVPASGEPHELDYVMRRGDQGWKAVDVLSDGTISRVAVQRSDFRRLLSSGGAQALFASLERKTGDLSGGTVR